MHLPGYVRYVSLRFFIDVEPLPFSPLYAPFHFSVLLFGNPCRPKVWFGHLTDINLFFDALGYTGTPDSPGRGPESISGFIRVRGLPILYAPA